MRQNESRFENRWASNRLEDSTVFEKRSRSTFSKYNRNSNLGDTLKTLELHSQQKDTHGKPVTQTLYANKRKRLESMLHQKTAYDSVPESCKPPMIGDYFFQVRKLQVQRAVANYDRHF